MTGVPSISNRIIRGILVIPSTVPRRGFPRYVGAHYDQCVKWDSYFDSQRTLWLPKTLSPGPDIPTGQNHKDSGGYPSNSRSYKQHPGAWVPKDAQEQKKINLPPDTCSRSECPQEPRCGRLPAF